MELYTKEAMVQLINVIHEGKNALGEEGINNLIESIRDCKDNDEILTMASSIGSGFDTLIGLVISAVLVSDDPEAELSLLEKFNGLQNPDDFDDVLNSLAEHLRAMTAVETITE